MVNFAEAKSSLSYFNASTLTHELSTGAFPNTEAARSNRDHSQHALRTCQLDRLTPVFFLARKMQGMVCLSAETPMFPTPLSDRRLPYREGSIHPGGRVAVSAKLRLRENKGVPLRFYAFSLVKLPVTATLPVVHL